MILLNYLLGKDKTDPNISTNKELNDFLPPIVIQPQPLLDNLPLILIQPQPLSDNDNDEYNLNNNDSNNRSKLFNINILLDYYNN